MKKTKYINITFENGRQDEINEFDSVMSGKFVKKTIEEENLLIEGDVNFDDVLNLDNDDYISISTDEGDVTVFVTEKEESEEWYEILSDRLIEEGIKHKVAATGTIYINWNDSKLRISDHEHNSFNVIDLDADMIEDNFDEFIETLENANHEDDFNEFLI